VTSQLLNFEIDPSEDIFKLHSPEKKRKRGRPPVHPLRTPLLKKKIRSLSVSPMRKIPNKIPRGPKSETKKKKKILDITEMVPDFEGPTEAVNLHCHHCKKRRPRCAVCPYNKTHRYCQNCVKR
jgi:hypothetical protein